MELLLYYNDGKSLTPIGLLTGTLQNEIHDIHSILNFGQLQPIHNHDNNYCLNWFNYSPDDKLLTDHYDYLMATHEFSPNESNLLIYAHDDAEVYVFDEAYHGFTFIRPSFLELKGTLSRMFIIAENLIGPIDEVIEERIHLDPKINSCTVEVINGSLLVFICDHQTFYILPTMDCHYKMKIPIIDHSIATDNFLENHKLLKMITLRDSS
ncbi:hypothetical protein BLA29_000344 [Euroglyphus maynei]|uniref:Uncharacterized protein n=1 Tax=Euroglyphus maynei TaxID=6958 RepID=A0A1Y3AUR1_EURMA|nr:hypothetical protein BLA29_000344 [Euroglyphus maynei]